MSPSVKLYSKMYWTIIATIALVLLKETVSEELDTSIGDRINEYEEEVDRLEDARMNFTELAVKYAGECEEHNVNTTDGYILTLFRLPNEGARPVMLQHGQLGSAVDFVLRGPESLAVILHQAGYDVWVSNIRGNTYARRHETLDPDVDREFWNFNIQQVVVYDMTAIIDYILDKTDWQQLAAIGHSVGTSLFYILGAERPEYNDKVSVMISLAPIYYMFNSESQSTFHRFWPIFDQLFETLKVDEISSVTLGQRYVVDNCLRAFNFLGEVTASSICWEMTTTYSLGFDAKEVEPEFTTIIREHWPSSTSRHYFMHYAQIGHSRRFAKYDYGLQNIVKYGSPFPPLYDISLTDMPIALISGKDDTVSTLQDVELLKPLLPNLVDHIILEPENFNHVDFIWGRHIKEILYPHISNLLEKYT